jgi:hypothetical protein
MKAKGARAGKRRVFFISFYFGENFEKNRQNKKSRYFRKPENTAIAILFRLAQGHEIRALALKPDTAWFTFALLHSGLGILYIL